MKLNFNFNDNRVPFGRVCYESVTCRHIDDGWLRWMNNPEVTKYLTGGELKYTRSDLVHYLNRNDHINFLACYDYLGNYFGNLRLYEIADGCASFGRLIGDPALHGKGYGKELVNFATHLLFDFYEYSKILVGNSASNLSSKNSKISVGYTLADNRILDDFGITEDVNYEYYIFSKSDYLVRKQEN